MPNFGASSGKVHAFWQFHGAPYKTYCVQVIGLPLPSLCMSLFFVISSSPLCMQYVVFLPFSISSIRRPSVRPSIVRLPAAAVGAPDSSSITEPAVRSLLPVCTGLD